MLWKVHFEGKLHNWWNVGLKMYKSDWDLIYLIPPDADHVVYIIVIVRVVSIWYCLEHSHDVHTF